MGNDTTHNLAPIAAAALANRLDRVTPVKIADRFQLLHGPYRSPKTRPGRKLFCEIRGTVTVAGFGDGRSLGQQPNDPTAARPFSAMIWSKLCGANRKWPWPTTSASVSVR